MNSYDGTVEVIYGPMFSGKSTELKRRVNRHKLANKNILLIKYIHNTRNSEDYEDNIISNLKDSEIITKNLYDLDKDYLNTFDIIGIDEAQFFDNLKNFCEKWANLGKKIIISCLDSTFERKDFKKVSKLISIAESVTKLYAVCNLCGKNASFTKRINESKELMLLGGIENYISCCRKCYFN